MFRLNKALHLFLRKFDVLSSVTSKWQRGCELGQQESDALRTLSLPLEARWPYSAILRPKVSQATNFSSLILITPFSDACKN